MTARMIKEWYSFFLLYCITIIDGKGSLWPSHLFSHLKLNRVGQNQNAFMWHFDYILIFVWLQALQRGPRVSLLVQVPFSASFSCIHEELKPMGISFFPFHSYLYCLFCCNWIYNCNCRRYFEFVDTIDLP